MPFREQFQPQRFTLQHRQYGKVEAELRQACAADVLTWQKSWRPVLLKHTRPDGVWPWGEHITRAESEQGYLSLAVARNGVLDALMSLTEKKEKSRLIPNRDIIYIEYVGVAPEHQPVPVGNRNITGLGRFMLEVAAQVSVVIGGDGLIGLHAKPDVEDFYRALRLHECAAEKCEDGVWRYFEACTFWQRGENLRRGRITQ